MVKEKRILSYFIGWLIMGIIICFIGITNVFADEMERVGFLSDKTDIQIVVPYNGTPLTLDQYGEYYLTEADQLLIFIDNYNFIAGDIYQLELYLPNATLTNANMFTVSGTNSNNETVSCSALKILQDNKQYVNYRWRCNKDVDSLTFTIKNSNNENIVSAGTFRWDYSFLWNVLSTTDNSEIIDGLDKVEDAIIESNKETQDVIKDELNTCRDSYNLLNVPENYSVTLRDIFEMNISKGTYTLSFDSYNSNGESNAFLIQFYNSETSLSKYFFFTNKETTFELDQDFTSITIYSQSSYNGSVDITTTFNKLMLQKGSVATEYEPYGEEICKNKLDELQETLTDSSPTDMSGLGDSAGWLPPGPVDSILNLPLTFFLNLSESLSSECKPVELTLPFVNEKIYLPCIRSLYDKMGVTGTIFNYAGVIASAIILFNYLLALYKWVDDTLTMRENTMPGYYEDNWGGGA